MLYQITDWDDAYANGAHIPEAEAYLPRWTQAAAAFRAGHRPLPLGRGHLFLPAHTPRGLMVFVHGGYWMRFDPSTWSHLAAGAIALGWACAIPAYRLAPRVRIAQITQDVARAVAKAAFNVKGPVVLTGHSAGGHLAARMICEGVLPDRLAARITACVPISPLTDLRALLRTAMNQKLRLDAAEALSESPALLTPRANIPVTTWVGAAERPEFIRHARLLTDAWAGLGTATECIIDPGRHHYDVIDGLTDPASPLMRRLLDHGA